MGIISVITQVGNGQIRGACDPAIESTELISLLYWKLDGFDLLQESE